MIKVLSLSLCKGSVSGSKRISLGRLNHHTKIAAETTRVPKMMKIVLAALAKNSKCFTLVCKIICHHLWFKKPYNQSSFNKICKKTIEYYVYHGKQVLFKTVSRTSTPMISPIRKILLTRLNFESRRQLLL